MTQTEKRIRKELNHLEKYKEHFPNSLERIEEQIRTLKWVLKDGTARPAYMIGYDHGYCEDKFKCLTGTS